MKNGVTHDNRGFDVCQLSDQQLRDIQEVYVCPSFKCNLCCPHCTLKNLPIKTDLCKVINTINQVNSRAGDRIFYDLFGGEPLLFANQDFQLLIESFQDKKFTISTNLLPLQDSHIQYLAKAVWINTSWNPDRFTNDQYDLWIKNLRKLQQNSIKINLMVTLTKSLIENYSPKQFLQLLRFWDCYSIDLDYVIGLNYPDPQVLDDWMFNLYINWNVKTKFNIVQSIKDSLISGRKFKDCSNAYAILPTGNIKHGCAYCEVCCTKFACQLCEFFDFCNGGCSLTEQCSFPKKIFCDIRDGLNGND